MHARSKLSYLLIASLASIAPSAAHAHFKLLKPASWLKEDSLGGPQKGSPCGPGGTGFLGDDVQPVPLSNEVTTFTAGEKIMVEIEETIYHPGYFRIALAEDRAKFDIPPVDNPMSCAIDLSKVPTGPRDDYVLADGLFKAEPLAGSNRKLMHEVTLPNKPCEKCTLQVIQVMKDHGLSSCYYYHCADIKIVAAEGAAGSGAAGAASGAAGIGASAGTSGGAAGATGTAGAASPVTAGAGGMSVAGTSPGAAGLGAAGETAATAGSMAAAGSGAAGAGAAGIGSIDSPATVAGTGSTATQAGTGAGSLGGEPPALPAADGGSSCAVASRGAGLGNTFASALFALVACTFIVRRRQRMSRSARKS